MAKEKEMEIEVQRESLSEEVIENLKNDNWWEESPLQWTFDEEFMSMPWLWPHTTTTTTIIDVDTTID